MKRSTPSTSLKNANRKRYSIQYIHSLNFQSPQSFNSWTITEQMLSSPVCYLMEPSFTSRCIYLLKVNQLSFSKGKIYKNGCHVIMAKFKMTKLVQLSFQFKTYLIVLQVLLNPITCAKQLCCLILVNLVSKSSSLHSFAALS